MNRQRILTSLLVLVLALSLAAGLSRAEGPVSSPYQGEGRVGVELAPLGTAFTYQGQLKQGGNPVNGTCDFQFSLWDAASGGAQVGSTLTKSSVTLDAGNFSVDLDFGANAFRGYARYLQIAMRCPTGSGSYTTLSGRVSLTAAPYAHSLRPGANISSDTAGQLGAVLYVEDTYSGMLVSTAFKGQSTNGTGVYGESLSSTGIGVEGKAASTGKGVRGETFSGYGVYGEATSSSGVTYGVYGKTNSSSGHGVYGTSPSTNPVYAGVTGVNTGGGAGSGVYGYSVGGYGVRGLATSGTGIYGEAGSGTGVYGTGSITGTVGIATASGGTTYGVYGKATSAGGNGVYGYSASGHGVHGKANPPDGYAIYAEGNAYVDGRLYWKAMPSYVSIATSAFIPELYNDAGHVEYDNEGYRLKNESPNSEWYTAPVQLPHEAVVTQLNVCWKDFSNVTAHLYLYRRSLASVTSPAQVMAMVDSVGSVGSGREGCWSDSTIEFGQIDNAGYAYYLEVHLPAENEDLELYGVSIAYQTGQPY